MHTEKAEGSIQMDQQNLEQKYNNLTAYSIHVLLMCENIDANINAVLLQSSAGYNATDHSSNLNYLRRTKGVEKIFLRVGLLNVEA